MSRIVTFGEIMMRLEPPGYARLVQTDSFRVVFGGAEANVALGLASLGDDAAFVTRLPAHAMGDAAVNSLRRYGVDTRHIARGGSRVGIYFNEKGADLRGGVCIYDRSHSAISEASAADFDWDEIMRGAGSFPPHRDHSSARQADAGYLHRGVPCRSPRGGGGVV